jgi:hypothetical protein
MQETLHLIYIYALLSLAGAGSIAMIGGLGIGLHWWITDGNPLDEIIVADNLQDYPQRVTS